MTDYDAISKALALRDKALRGLERWKDRVVEAERDLAEAIAAHTPGHHTHAAAAPAEVEEPEAETETPAAAPAPTANPFTPFSND